MIKNHVLQYLFSELIKDFEIKEPSQEDSLLIIDNDYEVAIIALGASTFQVKVHNILSDTYSDVIDIDELEDLPFEAVTRCLKYYIYGMLDGLETFA